MGCYGYLDLRLEQSQGSYSQSRGAVDEANHPWVERHNSVEIADCTFKGCLAEQVRSEQTQIETRSSTSSHNAVDVQEPLHKPPNPFYPKIVSRRIYAHQGGCA